MNSIKIKCYMEWQIDKNKTHWKTLLQKQGEPFLVTVMLLCILWTKSNSLIFEVSNEQWKHVAKKIKWQSQKNRCKSENQSVFKLFFKLKYGIHIFRSKWS